MAKIELGPGTLYFGEVGVSVNKGDLLIDPTDPDVLRCVQMDCYNNVDGVCDSRDPYRAPELGEECPVYSED